MLSALAGMAFGLSLIVAVGAQNIFVLRQGLRREHVGLVAGICAVSDFVLISLGVGGLGSNGGPTPTVALHRGSPAIGAAGADAPSRDQRNLARRDPDAGAFERR